MEGLAESNRYFLSRVSEKGSQDPWPPNAFVAPRG